MAMNTLGGRTVVVGAGIRRLTAAAALADYFEQVVVFERDALSSVPAHRTGTPQSRHLHALLAGGLRAFGELFVGFEQKLALAGGPRHFALARQVRRISPAWYVRA